MLRSFPRFAAMRRFLPWLALGLGVWWSSRGISPSGGLPVGDKLPSLTATLTDGAAFTLAGEPVQITVLNFWASYCEPCRVEAPLLSAVQAQDVRVVGLSVEDMPAHEIERRARALGMRYPVGSASADLMTRFQVRALPTTYVVARDGVIVLSRVGAVTRSELTSALEAARSRNVTKRAVAPAAMHPRDRDG
jgi:cytochrome c biogenesis protein CcmG/thiol:disulfide interchange protein DsbE